MGERAGGRADIWRLKLARARLFATEVNARIITANPGVSSEKRTVLPTGGVQNSDKRIYELQKDGSFTFPYFDGETKYGSRGRGPERD